MSALTELLLDPETATRAVLTRVCWIHQNHLSTSFLRFVDGVRSELSPGRVSNALRQFSVANHLRGVQVLEDYGAVPIHDTTAKFVREVGSAVANTFVYPRHSFPSETSLGCSFLGSCEPTLYLSERFLIGPEETTIADFLTFVSGQEALETHVDANRFLGPSQPFEFFDLYREADEPLTGRGPLNGGCLDCTFDRSVKLNPDGTDLPDAEYVVFKNCTTGVLRETERVVPILALESWVPSFLTCFDAAEKTLKSQINSVLNILENLGVHLTPCWVFFLPIGEELISVEQPEGFLVVFPSISAYFEGLIVNPSTKTQPLVLRVVS